MRQLRIFTYTEDYSNYYSHSQNKEKPDFYLMFVDDECKEKVCVHHHHNTPPNVDNDDNNEQFLITK